MEKINLGIIGFGHWGPNYVRNFSSLGLAKVKYVCDIQRNRLKSVKSQHPQIITTVDYKDILKDNSIHAVVISTNASSHYELVSQALIHDKHVLVEKPFVLDIKDGQKLIDLSEKRQKIIMVAHTFLYNLGIRKLKDLIRNKSLGRIYYLHSKRTNLGPLRKDVSALWDLAPHDISIFNYLLEAEPIEVFARGNQYLQSGKEKEDVVFATLTYPKNIIANIHVSWLDPRKVREITIVGDKKMVVFDDLNIKEPVHLYDKRVMKRKFRQDYDSFEEFQMIIRDGKITAPKVKIDEPLKLECKHFIDCIIKHKTPLTDCRDGFNVLRILSGIQQSLDNKGERVSFDNSL